MPRQEPPAREIRYTSADGLRVQSVVMKRERDAPPRRRDELGRSLTSGSAKARRRRERYEQQRHLHPSIQRIQMERQERHRKLLARLREPEEERGPRRSREREPHRRRRERSLSPLLRREPRSPSPEYELTSSDDDDGEEEDPSNLRTLLHELRATGVGAPVFLPESSPAQEILELDQLFIMAGVQATAVGDKEYNEEVLRMAEGIPVRGFLKKQRDIMLPLLYSLANHQQAVQALTKQLQDVLFPQLASGVKDCLGQRSIESL